MQERQNHKPTTMNLDKGFKFLTEQESFYMLNHDGFVSVYNGNKGNNLGKGKQFAANYPACDMELPAGENYSISPKGFYSPLTKESYNFVYNSNGVHFISRANSDGECAIVYYGPCLPLSADPKRAITDWRCYMKYDKTCKNRHGKALIFVTGDFEGWIDVEASIATNNFTTPFFQRCSSGCEYLKFCVPDPPSCPMGEIVLLTDADKNLQNFLLNRAIKLRYRWVYYDYRASIWSQVSTVFYQDGHDEIGTQFGRKIKLRIPIGNPLVEKIEIAFSEDDGKSWNRVDVIDKYKQYNSNQQYWYERELGELENYSDEDCSFDYYFYGDKLGTPIDPSETNRNFNHHPRGAQGMIQIKNSLGFYNYDKGSCPIDKIQADKFKVLIDMNKINVKNGLKSGGKYEFGFIAKGDCGKYSFVHGRQIVDIPRWQDTTNTPFGTGFHEFTYNAVGLTLPDWVTGISIVRTANLNRFELQWRVDGIERKDGNIIITIQSLNDYNENYGFKTNTVYQFLEGDSIEFIMNGDLSIFQTAAHGLLNYKILGPNEDGTVAEPPTDFFNQLIIKDDGRLNGLSPGAIFELQRLNKTNDGIFYEICKSIPVVNGSLVYEIGSFNTFDTYRKIRTLVGGAAMTIEHHSPNDLWPYRISDGGRVHIANEYSDELRYGRNLTINAENQYNWFGDLEKVFPAKEQGDITAMFIWDGKVVVAIGEHDNFLGQVGDDFLRVGSDGVIRAAPVDAIVSDPEPKVSGKYGLQYDHIGSVIFGDGFVEWADVNRSAWVKHDFNSADDVAEGKTQSYFRTRCQEIEFHNRTATSDLDKLRFIAGHNRFNDVSMITIKRLRDSGINNSKKIYEKKNETILFHAASNEWLGFASFTPEAYGDLSLFDGSGCMFIAYLHGQPFIHPLISDSFNEFFGVACDEVVGITINKFSEKAKRPLALEVQSEMMWFAHEVTTDKTNFLSEIPPVRWKKENGKWSANFLFNKNSVAGLYGNNGASQEARGSYVNVVLVRDNTTNNIYGSVNNEKRKMYNELDTIFSKFAVIEQSGMTENL